MDEELKTCDFSVDEYFNPCVKDASFKYTTEDGHVRYLCKEHIGTRILKMAKDAKVTVERIK